MSYVENCNLHGQYHGDYCGECVEASKAEVEEWKAKYLEARKSGYLEGLEEAKMNKAGVEETVKGSLTFPKKLFITDDKTWVDGDYVILLEQEVAQLRKESRHAHTLVEKIQSQGQYIDVVVKAAKQDNEENSLLKEVLTHFVAKATPHQNAWWIIDDSTYRDMKFVLERKSEPTATGLSAINARIQSDLNLALKYVREEEDDNTRLRKAMDDAAEALFRGSKALQTFVPGSEAHRLQQAVDEAHGYLSGAL